MATFLPPGGPGSSDCSWARSPPRCAAAGNVPAAGIKSSGLGQGFRRIICTTERRRDGGDGGKVEPRRREGHEGGGTPDGQGSIPMEGRGSPSAAIAGRTVII